MELFVGHQFSRTVKLKKKFYDLADLKLVVVLKKSI